MSLPRCRHQVRRVIKLSHDAVEFWLRRFHPKYRPTAILVVVQSSTFRLSVSQKQQAKARTLNLSPLPAPASCTCRLFFNFRFRQNRTHLEDGDHWQEADEQEQQRKEKSQRADKHCPVPHRRLIHAPGRRQEVAM